MMCTKKLLSYPASLSQDERMKYRDSFAGKSSATEVLPDGSAIYTAENNGRFYLTVFAGKALRPGIRVYFQTPNSRANAIENFKQRRASYHALMTQRKQAARKPHTLKVGDILNTSWGYEQTGVEFYEVVTVSGVMVTLREIAAKLTTTGSMSMSGTKYPYPGQFIGEPFRRRANAHNAVKIHRSARARPWDGRPKHETWYG